MSTTERAVSTDLAEALSDAIREEIIDLMSCGDEVRDMVGEALLDHLGSETVRKEVDRHIREAVQSNDVASKEYKAIQHRLTEIDVSAHAAWLTQEEETKRIDALDARIGELDRELVDRICMVHARLDKADERLEMAEAVLDATKALIDAEVTARRRDYAELNRLVHALEGGLTTISTGLLSLQEYENRRQSSPWRRLVRRIRGLVRKGADA